MDNQQFVFIILVLAKKQIMKIFCYSNSELFISSNSKYPLSKNPISPASIEFLFSIWFSVEFVRESQKKNANQNQNRLKIVKNYP